MSAKKTISPAERKRRHDRVLHKRFLAAGGAATTLSEVERRCPCDVDPALLVVSLHEIRHRFRSRKKVVYGSNIAKKVERLFGPLKPAHRAFLVDWVNWLVQTRAEVVSGRYSGKNAPATIANMIAGVGNAEVAAVASAPLSIRAKAKDDASIDRSTKGADPYTPERASSASPTQETVEVQSPQAYKTSPPVANSDLARSSESSQRQLHDEEAVRAARAKVEGSNEWTDEATSHADSLPGLQGALNLGNSHSPIRPAPFSFTFKVEGETDANDFFRSIYQVKPIDDILAAANKLADNPSAVKAVIRRGSVEAAYLAKSMADLGVKLP